MGHVIHSIKKFRLSYQQIKISQKIQLSHFQFGKGNVKGEQVIIYYPDIDFTRPKYLGISTGPDSEGSWIFTETYGRHHFT